MDIALMDQFDRYGYVVVPQLLWEQECDELVDAGYKLAAKLVKQTNDMSVFSTKSEVQLKQSYFLESNDKMRPFAEEGAIDAEGKFTVNPNCSLNKIGHALHWLHPLFRCYTFCDRVQTKCKRLGLVKPAVVQSMILFKNPGFTSEVQPHQDATFLFSEPFPTIGFWIALDDATIENGCLWIASGSHKSGIHRRLTRSQQPNGEIQLVYDRPNPVYPASSFRPVPVKKGDCIILHGHVVHMSGVNKTNKPRPAYTFHMIEKKYNTYSPDNWLQEGPDAPFRNMYKVKQYIFDEYDSDMNEKISDNKLEETASTSKDISETNTAVIQTPSETPSDINTLGASATELQTS